MSRGSLTLVCQLLITVRLFKSGIKIVILQNILYPILITIVIVVLTVVKWSLSDYTLRGIFLNHSLHSVLLLVALGTAISFSVGWIVTCWTPFQHFFLHHMLWCLHLYQQHIHLQQSVEIPPSHRYKITLVHTFASLQISVNVFLL